MSNIDKQAVQAVADLKAGYTLGHADVEIIQQMALDAVTLLDELQAKDKRLNKILTPNMLLPVIDDMDADNLRRVVKTASENYSLLHAKWEAAEKRIAELEARTLVTVEPTLDQLVAGKRRLTSTGRMSRLMSQRLAEVYRAMVNAAAAGKGEVS